MTDEVETVEDGKAQRQVTPEQWTLIGLTVACLVGAMLYRWLRYRHLEHSAGMFMGIPAVLAILLALTPKAKSVVGAIMKGITLMMLIVAPLLGEGFLCILIASPIFYLVGALVGAAVEWGRRRRATTLSCVAIVLLPMCLEGVVPGWTVGRDQVAEVTRVVDAPADAVEAALARSPRLGVGLPEFLRIGFPRPLAAEGEGLEVGATRTLHFAAAEGAPAGDLVMRVEARGSEVWWTPIDAGHTRVTWRISFLRRLDPAWYFGAVEGLAVHEAARYMIAANATPEER
jgi:hypothetical protein